jgi:hypothetical protein
MLDSRGWARSASGDTAEGISWILDGIDDWRATGSIQSVPYYLALKAEATAYRFPDRFVWVVNRNNNTVPLMNVARDSKIQECFFAQTISRVPTTATRRGALLP